MSRNSRQYMKPTSSRMDRVRQNVPLFYRKVHSSVSDRTQGSAPCSNDRQYINPSNSRTPRVRQSVPPLLWVGAVCQVKCEAVQIDSIYWAGQHM